MGAELFTSDRPNPPEFNRGTHTMRVEADGVSRCRYCHTDERFIGLDYCLNLERSYTTRTVRFGAPDMVAEVDRARHGYPWCDTCQVPSIAVGMGQGLRHVTVEWPMGVPQHLDAPHEVTHHQWFEVPS